MREVLEKADVVVGEQVFVSPVDGFAFPLKVVASFGGETVTIVTNFPLKKGEKR